MLLIFSIFKSLNCIKELFDDVKNISNYSNIDMLLAVQILLTDQDSKDFVDRATRGPLSKVVKEFNKLEKELNLGKLTSEILDLEHSITLTHVPSELSNYVLSKKISDHKSKSKKKIQSLQNFVEKNFHPVGYDIAHHNPVDFTESPEILSKLKNTEVKKMVTSLNKIWKDLSRKSVKIPDDGVSSLLDLPYPFIIPGGRFREFYYWDTYWILEGLLVCDMYKSAENIVRNFISIIQDLGYIPNGTRKYYMYRSQPPYFPMMLLKLLDIENGKYNDLVLNDGLDAALKEYDFWQKYRQVEIFDKNGNSHLLNHFHVHTNFPRPESFGEDVLTYEKQASNSEEIVFSNLKSGAESGWDFSSRWLEKEDELESIEAFAQVNVDLNAILFRNEQIIAVLLDRKGQTSRAEEFLEKSKIRENSINSILWNSSQKMWMDFVPKTDKFVEHRFYFSNIEPLIYGISIPDKSVNKFDLLRKYQKELFGYPGGIPASGDGIFTGQQWDFPNVWAPHQHMLFEFLKNENEHVLAFHVAKSFFNSVYEGFIKGNAFYEKYDSIELGNTGEGGEYAPQTGFGWTNGTVLSFISSYGDKLMDKYDHKQNYENIKKLLEDNSIQSEKNAFMSSSPFAFDKLFHVDRPNIDIK